MPDNDTLPTGHQPAIRVLAMPTDTNASGDIFDGWLMSQVDIAGNIEAFVVPGSGSSPSQLTNSVFFNLSMSTI